MTHVRMVAAAVCTAVVGLGAGCGGNDAAREQEYVAALDSYRAVERTVRNTFSPCISGLTTRDWGPCGAAGGPARKAIGDALSRLEAVEPPEEAAAADARLRKELRNLDATIERQGAAIEAGRGGTSEVTKVSAVIDALDAAVRDLERVLEGLDLPKFHERFDRTE